MTTAQTPAQDVSDSVIIREASDVLEAVGVSGVMLPDNWRWPLADELNGIAACMEERARELQQAQVVGLQVSAGVHEALQRMIEDGPIKGPASEQDAILVSDWYRRITQLTTPQSSAPVVGDEMVNRAYDAFNRKVPVCGAVEGFKEQLRAALESALTGRGSP